MSGFTFQLKPNGKQHCRHAASRSSSAEVTATGGGVVRDVLLNEVPVVLQRELYAVPAFTGALAFALMRQTRPLSAGVVASVVAVLLTAGLRLVSVWRGWHAPRPGAL